MKDYPRKALLIIWLTYFSFALFQLFTNDTLIFPTPMNAIVLLGIAFYVLFQEFRSATQFERFGLLLFLFFAIILLISDSFMLSLFLNHEMVSDMFLSPVLIIAQNLGLLALLGSLLVIAYYLGPINKVYAFFYSLFFATLCVLGFVDVHFEALIVLTAVGALSLILVNLYRQKIPSATAALMYLWVIHVSISCFEFWNMNL